MYIEASRVEFVTEWLNSYFFVKPENREYQGKETL